MKKLFLSIAIICSLSSFAQKKDSTITITDSTALLSYKDYLDFNRDVLSEFPSKYTDIIRQWWISRLNQRIEALKPKKK